MSLSQGSKESGTNEWKKYRKKYTRHHKTIRNSCVQNCCACSTLIQRCLLDLVELTKDLCLTKTVLNLSLHNTKFGPLFPRVAWEVEVYTNLNDIQAILPWLKAFVSHFHLAWEGSLIWVWHNNLGPISGIILHTVSWMVGMTRHTRQADPFHYYTFIMCGNEKKIYDII